MSKDLEVPFDPKTAALPTFLINRTTVFANGGLVRMTFGEGFPTGAVEGPLYVWRMAIAMTLDDALEVAEIILAIAAEQKRRMDALRGQVAPDGTITPQGSA